MSKRRAPMRTVFDVSECIELFIQMNGWCPGAESNHRHEDFQSSALPTELPGHWRRKRVLNSRAGKESSPDFFRLIS